MFILQWHRMPTTQETDGFQVKRPGDVNVKCTLLLMLDHQVCYTSARTLPVSWICFWHFLINPLYLSCSASSVQAGSTVGSSPGCAHADTGQHHASSLAVHQKQQAAGRSREGVHQLQPLLQTGNENARKHVLRIQFFYVVQEGLGLRRPRPTAFCGNVEISHKLIKSRVLSFRRARLKKTSPRK